MNFDTMCQCMFFESDEPSEDIRTGIKQLVEQAKKEDVDSEETRAVLLSYRIRKFMCADLPEQTPEFADKVFEQITGHKSQIDWVAVAKFLLRPDKDKGNATLWHSGDVTLVMPHKD